jgi:spore germination protein KC
MLTISSTLKNDYGNPMISEVSLPKRVMQPASGKGGEQFAQTLELSGAAVFKKDRMIGWLTREECRGISWMLNGTKNTVVTVFDPEHENRGVAVETSGVKAKLRSKIVDGMPEFTISISGSGDIAEEDASTNSGISEMKSDIARLVNKKIEEEVKNSLETIQKKYKVDCLGFAAICHTQNKEKWHEGIKDRWQEIFPKIPVSVSADIKIKTSTLNQEPMKIK